MLFNSIQFLTLALAGLAVASPLPDIEERQTKYVLIAYRTAGASEVKAINDAGGHLVYDSKEAIGNKQLGSGIYTTPNIGGWNGADNSEYCAISVDGTKFDALPKIWIPEKNGPTTLWMASETVIDEYIKKTNSKLDPSKTLRLAKIKGDAAGTLQMLIPSALVGSKGGPMDNKVVCSKKKADLGTHKVDYASWKNVYGVAQ